MNHHTRRTAAAAGIALVALASACSDSADNRERRASNDIQQAYIDNQPIPAHTWSQLRQSLIEIENVQIETTPTFSYFFAPGRADAAPVFSCPSIGLPIPSSFNLTNPQKVTNSAHHDSSVIAQMEPTGVFTGDTDGTNVICVAPNGEKYLAYWEGQVFATTRQVVWNGQALTPVADAASSATFTTKD